MFGELVEKVEDIEWFERASEENIQKLEEGLNTTLPKSYKEFLKTYGAGGVVDEDISGIVENNPLSLEGGSCYGDTLRVREDFNLPNHLIAIYYHDDEVCWCLDTKAFKEDECPVVSYDLFNEKLSNKIADDFRGFFKEYLELRA